MTTLAGSSGQQALGNSFGLDSTVPDFGSETYRLMRDDWASQGVNVFSQEVFALMQLLTNFNTTGTATYNQQTPTAPLTVNQPFSLGAAPAIVINKLDQNGNPIAAEQIAIGPAGVTQGGEPIGGGSSSFPGVVQSGGPGSSYIVKITLEGGVTENVSVTQLGIDPTATINPGTACIVIQLGTAFFMNVPTWG